MSSTTTYRVPGISCGHCETAITEELSQVTGVETIDVDIEAKLVRVSGSGADQVQVIAAIDEAGYEAAIA